MKPSLLSVVIVAALIGLPAIAVDHLWQRYTDQGQVYLKRAKYSDAEKQYRAALNRAKQLKDHKLVRQSYHDLAMLLYNAGRYEQAEPQFKKAIACCNETLKSACKEKSKASDACCLLVEEMTHLADCYRAEGKYKLAEALYRAALKHQISSGQEGTVAFGATQSELADVLSLEGGYREAERLYNEAMPVFEKNQAIDELVDLLQDYDALLHITNRLGDSQPIEARLQSLRKRPLEAAAETDRVKQ